VIDGTLGAGGHSRALLECGVKHVLGLDLDTSALTIAQENLSEFADRAIVKHSSYVNMREQAEAIGWDQVDGILLDLGLSSMQLDTPERGFAFMYDAPLDMRFDLTSANPTAAELVNSLSAADLADIFFKYGEEKQSRKIAQAIVEKRPIETTKQLAEVIEKSVPRIYHKKQKSIHPATLVFQALRIVVNRELQSVEQVLPIAVDLLRPGGRLAVISFHSLEDRIVKQTFKDMATEIIAPPGMASIEEKDAIIDLVTRKPLVADESEIQQNPRSRSAKLRVVEKL
jgi:16S rRNA (cytosine1402-N4)-methyltransferase